jgi:hypothetical protein
VALTPLTRVQQATVLALVEARRLDVVPADAARAEQVARTLLDAALARGLAP